MREFSRRYDKQEHGVSRFQLAVNVMLNLSIRENRHEKFLSQERQPKVNSFPFLTCLETTTFMYPSIFFLLETTSVKI